MSASFYLKLYKRERWKDDVWEDGPLGSQYAKRGLLFTGALTELSD